MKLAHISDLHVSGGYFVPEYGDAVVKKINEAQPDLLIVSGDFTDDGHLFEYEKAAEFMDRFHVKEQFLIPGNHDSRNEGYKLFEEFFGERFPKYENDKILIQGLDSSSPDTDSGHLGRENYHYIQNMKSSKKMKVIVIHHHMIPVPGTGREENVLTDSGDALGMVVESGVNLVLNGHRHLPWIWRLERTHFITTGTATTWRLKGRSNPAMNFYTIEDDYLILEQYNIAEEKISERSKLHLVDW